MTYGYGQGQNGQLWGVSTYDQYIAGVRPGDSWSTAQQKMGSHYAATGRDASGNSLYASAGGSLSLGARPVYAGGSVSAGGAYAGGSGGAGVGAGAGVVKLALALVVLVPLLIGLAGVVKTANAVLFPPPLTLAQAIDKLPVPRYATPALAERLEPGAAAYRRLSRPAMGREALRALRLTWRAPEAMAAGAAAMKRIGEDPAWDVELRRPERDAMLTLARRWLLLKAMDGSVEAAVDSGLLDVSPGLGIYEPKLAMVAWKNALKAHPGDAQLQAVLDAYEPLIGRDADR
ncbi:Uncharacterised protein [Burkholderia pseudomallei]|nr:Uncharacterised protein [Burkholderia pseudomallei]VCK72997.1 Uncharacterised protein [Burkholderia pseudomallei]VCK79892.1 Uncharacterised protein [Burkholderia pseudomallei]VCK80130.1 Uncharacterised protein [Burkholderia pseudomallei]VCK80884.1 Uncharacterised protein [Burkholderia pseudomallei]